ncbi:oxidoreductase [Planctomycetales bacterium]|nr:oxidoreductase [Planctomycetales bacterium]
MPSYPFLNSYEELQSELQRLGLNIPLSDDLSVLSEPLEFGGTAACRREDGQPVKYKLANRFIVQPMEGFDSCPNGEPGELSFRRYERFASGGASLIWFEATAVLNEARSNSQQFWINEKSADRFAALEEKTRSIARKKFGHEIVSVIQLTHSGRYSKPTRGVRAPVIAQHSGVLDAAHNIPTDYPLITDDELDRLQDAYIAAAKLAAKCGFDGVDIKSCHGYLLNELLGSYTREGKYGGTYENRTRFLKETIKRVCDEVPSVFVTSRLSVYDAVKYPWGFASDENNYKIWNLAEPKKLVAELQELGVPLLDITIGNPYFNPHFNRPYAKPIRGGTAYDENPLIGVARFVNIIGEMQAAFPSLPMAGAGTAWLRHLVPKVAAGIVKNGYASLFGQGRCSFAYPEAVKDILTKGEMDLKQVCLACSGCTELMRAEEPTGCVIRDRDFYRLP